MLGELPLYMVVLPSSKTNHVRSGKKSSHSGQFTKLVLNIHSFIKKKDDLHLSYVAVGQSIRKYTVYTRCWHGAWHMLLFDDAISSVVSSVLKFPSFPDFDLSIRYYFILV